MRALPLSRTNATSFFTRAASSWCKARARRNSSSSFWSRKFCSRPKLGYETVLNPDLLLPRIGVDESGKGDFFGPLCIAGVYVNESVISAWKDAGIRDSKNISSDKKIPELAELIRKTPGCVVDSVVDRQRSLQPALRENEKRQHAARVGPCARDRKSDGQALSDEPAAGAAPSATSLPRAKA